MELEQLSLAKSAEESLLVLAQIKQPDCALLYACVYAAGSTLTPKQAARYLGWDKERLDKAIQMLAVFDLVRDGVKPPIHDSAAADPRELLQSRRSDRAFAGLCDYFEQCKGRQMTQREMSILLNTYQSLNFPANVMGMLIGWCLESGHFSIQTIEREAYRWHNKGIHTFEQASAHLEALRRMNTYEAGVLRLFGQTGREAAETQKKYIAQWQAWGVSLELLELAYDRTLTAIGQLNWKYLHKILENWHAQGLKTRKQVEQGDKRIPPHRAEVDVQQPKQESKEARILRDLEQKRLQRERTLQTRLEALRGMSPEFRDNESALRLCASRMARSGGGEEREKLEQQRNLLLQRQQGILTRLGHPVDWLSDKPDCPYCGDRGYIGAKKCTCLLRLLEQDAQTIG